MTNAESRKEELLKQNGWTVECLSPFEIRHTESGSFATAQAAEIVAESLLPLEIPLQVYQDASVSAPPSAPWPLEKELFEEYVDTDTIVTFTVFIPLENLVLNGTVDDLTEYCQQAFGAGVEISDTEFRVIPNESDSDGWDQRFSGDVALQVTCTLQSVD